MQRQALKVAQAARNAIEEEIGTLQQKVEAEEAILASLRQQLQAVATVDSEIAEWRLGAMRSGGTFPQLTDDLKERRQLRDDLVATIAAADTQLASVTTEKDEAAGRLADAEAAVHRLAKIVVQGEAITIARQAKAKLAEFQALARDLWAIRTSGDIHLTSDALEVWGLQTVDTPRVIAQKAASEFGAAIARPHKDKWTGFLTRLSRDPEATP